MNALSRREEETLLKTTKARALQECDAFVKGIFDFFHPLINSLRQQLSRNAPRGGRCRLHGLAGTSSRISSNVCFNSEQITSSTNLRSINGFGSTGPEPMEAARQEYLRLRNQDDQGANMQRAQ